MMRNRLFIIQLISDVINRSFIAWRFLIWEMSYITVAGTPAVGQWKSLTALRTAGHIPRGVQCSFSIRMNRGWPLGVMLCRGFVLFLDQFSTF